MKNNKKGRVRWFSDRLGYGFVCGPGGEDVFVHYSSIKSENKYKSLTKGQRVQFSYEKGPSGHKATIVEVLS